MNNNVVQNASWIIGCKIVQSVISLVIGMISARYLGPSNYGLISYASSVVAFVLPIAQLGLGKTLVQELIERQKEEGTVLGSALALNVISSICCMIGVLFFMLAANPGEKTTIMVGVLCSFSLLFQALEVLQYWFQAKLLSKYMSLASLAAYSVAAAYKVFLLISGKGVVWFAVSSSIEYLLISVFLCLTYRRKGAPKLGLSVRLAGEMVSKSKYYIISTMMVTIFVQTDRIMLKLMMGEAETGIYSAAVNCIGVTSFVFSAIIDSMRPVILESKKKNQEQFEKRVKQLYLIIVFLSLLQSGAMTLLAKPIVWILYGEQYLPSVAVLQIAVWYITFSNLGSVRNIWILAEGKQKYLWIINLSGAVANVVLNACMIPVIGARGAAAASLMTQFFTNFLIGFMIRPIHYNNGLMVRSFRGSFVVESIKELIKR